MSLWSKFLSSERFYAAVAALVICVGVTAWGWDDSEAQAQAAEYVKIVLVVAGLFIGGKTLRKSEPKDESGSGS